jgi:hypothetical protein
VWVCHSELLTFGANSVLSVCVGIVQVWGNKTSAMRKETGHGCSHSLV